MNQSHPSTLPRIVITSGEPAGIGPDLCLMLNKHLLNAHLVVIGDVEMLKARARQLNVPFDICAYNPNNQSNNIPSLTVLNMPANAAIKAGTLDASNSGYVLKMLERAMDGCLNGEFDAMVTAPVHKGVINDAGIAFTGHTEFLAEYTHTPHVVMMLVGGGMRVALASIHIPLMQVSSAITQNHLKQTLRILHADLTNKFGINNPCIYVAGLNPHAGEDGYLGKEEIETINPVLNQLRAEGMNLVGALPADTMFSSKNLKQADAFLAMYHDQGLSVLKFASFGEGVNVTLGLPIIRTSVDHGTALDIAGTGKANVGSLIAAIHLAIDLAKHKTT